jgi:hypothetical protein
MEGLFGLGFGLLLYWPLASVFGEDLNNTWGTLTDSEFNTLCVIFMPFLFTLTGIFNIMATGATSSSMTRNVWRNMEDSIGLDFFFGNLLWHRQHRSG